MRRIDESHARVDAQFLQLVDELGDHAPLFHTAQHERQRQAFAVRVGQSPSADRPARFGQQIPRPQQRAAVAAYSRSDIEFEWIREHAGRQFIPEGGQEVDLGRGGHAHGGETRRCEIAIGSGVETPCDHPVVPAVVERQRQGFTHADILKMCPAAVDDEASEQAHVVLEIVLALDHPTLGQGVVVAVEPEPGVGFPPDVDETLAERLPGHGVVAVEVIADGAEIVAATVHSDIPAPVVGHAFVEQETRLLELGDAVRTAAEWRDLGRLGVVRFAPVVFGKDRDLAETGYDRRIQTVDVGQVDGAFTLAVDLHRLDHAEGGAQVERRVRRDMVEGEVHVPRRNGHAIVPARLRVQPDPHPAEIVGDHHPLGEIAVEVADLVVRRREQAVVKERVGAEVVLHARCDDALVQVGGERIPGIVGRQHHHAALGGIGIDVVEVLESGGVLELAEERHAVLEGRLGDRRAT